MVRTEKRLVLQACFDCTVGMFLKLQIQTSMNILTLTSYMSFCEDMCVQTKTVCTFNKNSPWFAAELRRLRQAKEEAYASGVNALCKQARNSEGSPFRQEVDHMVQWWNKNHLELNLFNTVEMTVDLRRKPLALPPLTILNNTASAVDTPRFTGATISQDSKWTCIFCPKEGAVELVLPETAQEVESAPGAPDYLLLCHHPVSTYPSHTAHKLLPSGRYYGTLCAETTRHRDSVFSQK